MFPFERCEVPVGVVDVPVGAMFVAVGTKLPLARCFRLHDVIGGPMCPIERCVLQTYVSVLLNGRRLIILFDKTVTVGGRGASGFLKAVPFVLFFCSPSKLETCVRSDY